MNQDSLMIFCPATGAGEPYPSHAAQWRAYHGNLAFLYNPWTGSQRGAASVGSDPFGLAIVPPGQELRAADTPKAKWRAWAREGVPPGLPMNSEVEVRCRDGSVLTGRIEELCWDKTGADSDIGEYRPVSVTKGL